MKLALFILGLMLPSFSQAQLILDLKENLTLRDVFDYGFRPSQVSFSRSSLIEQRDVQFSFRAYGKTYPVIEASKIEFNVLKNDKISTIIVFTKGTLENLNYLNEEQAYEVAKKFSGENRSKWRQGTIAAWSWPLFETQSTFRCTVGLRKTYNEEKPYTLGFTAKWNYPLSEIRTRQGPIEPPEGYEDWSMEPLPFVTSGEKQKSKLESNNQKNIPNYQEKKESTKEVVEDEKTDSLSWLYWILGALVLVGVVLVVRNSRKDSSAS